MSSAFILFIAGMAFCYFLVLPAIFHFIDKIKSSQITMLTDIDKYLSFVLGLFMVFGVAFEMPVIIFLLLRFQILSLAKARQIRPYMFVGCFIIAAIVTPPDVLSQTLLALPLYALYELGIIAGWLFIKPTSKLDSNASITTQP
jgi:sec-independent protein translocase protein TatC